ncbi:MAG: tRNA pseudouridine(55) synthase TruB [Prolixibacteraceae bacterium]|nr:tRNA pseudouridine(55) synthase TruB [Prolixibacteraceae bacterium]
MVYQNRNYDFLKGEVLLFDKGLAWSSFDLVQKVRNSLCREMGIKKLKVGHAGTLDPLATGLMILCTGKATKQIENIQEGKKEYIATITLGATTPSHDLETEIDKFYNYDHITEANLTEVFKKFTGNIEQVPPVFSAVKVGGKRAYSYARNGEEVKLKSRKIVIESIEIVGINLPEVEIKIVCSKGTYIRSLARDIGGELNTGAYLSALRRIKIGSFSVENAITVEYFLNNINSFVTN